MFSNKRSQSESLPTLIKHETSESEQSSSSATEDSNDSLSILSHSVGGSLEPRCCTFWLVPPSTHGYHTQTNADETGKWFFSFQNKSDSIKHHCTSSTKRREIRNTKRNDTLLSGLGMHCRKFRGSILANVKVTSSNSWLWTLMPCPSIIFLRYTSAFFFNWVAYRGWPDAQCAIHCITTPIAYDPEAFILKIRSSGGVASWHRAHSHRLAPDCRHYTVGVPKLRNTSLKQSLFSN